MKQDIINACETFSEGDVTSIAHHLSPNVKWTILGGNSIEGLDALLKYCAEMTSEGCPDFQNHRTTVGSSQIIVEGSERKRGGVSYCDSYSIYDRKITEIRSYYICPSKSSR